MGLKRSTAFSCWLAVVVACAAAFPPATVQAQGDAPERPPVSWEDRLADPIYMSWVRAEAIGECVDCHLSPSIGSALRGKDKDPFGTFSRRIEMERWLAYDKHAIARRRVEPFAADQSEKQLDVLFAKLQQQRSTAADDLKAIGIPVDLTKVQLKEVPREWIGQSNVLSRRICDKLWGDGSVTTPDGYAKFRDHCLTCHGGYETGKPGFDLAEVTSADANSQLGIDCNYCHQIGDQTDWVNAHRDVDNWRLLPPEAKAAAGMRHLVDTSNQASMCMDCHVGNQSKNMFVTHEMYAAGHPPIPSIELQKFCEEMPQHWQTPDQLYKSLAEYDGRDKYFAINYPSLTSKTPANQIFWKTRKMLVGALAARAKMLDLYIESASQSDHWADYSLYDCSACHHELKSNSERQQRYLAEFDPRATSWTPGRPRQNEWPDALLTIGYMLGGRDAAAQMRGIEAELDSMFAAQPFGNPNQVGPSAQRLRDRINDSIRVAETRPVTASMAKAVLRGLSTTPLEKMTTYDSARQVVWAMQTIASELRQAGQPLSTNIEAMIASLGDPAVTGIEADIPAGRKRFIYRENLDADLKLRARFEPAALKSKLNQLGSAFAAVQSPSSGAVRTVAGGQTRVGDQTRAGDQTPVTK